MANDQELRYKITTQADIGGADKAASAIEKVDQATSSGAQSGKDLAAGSREAARSLGDLRQAANGGAGGLLKVGDALGRIASFAKANPFAALSAGFFAVLPAIRAGFDQWVQRAEAATQKIVADNQRRVERQKQAEAELRAASKASLDAQIAGVDSLSSAYGRLIGQMDEARKRADALADARLARGIATLDRDEQAALAAAGSDPEREAIRRRFGRQREDLRAGAEENRLEEDVLNARNRINTASEAIAAQLAQLDAAVIAAREARAAAAAPLAISSAAVQQWGVGARSTQDLIAEAKLAEAAARAAEENLAAVRAATAAAIEKADADKRDAEATLELADIKRGTLRAQRTTRDLARGAEDSDLARARALDRAEAQRRIREINEGAEEAAGRGDFREVDQRVRERAQIERDQATLDNVATAVESAPAAPPLDAEPLRKSIITFQGRVIELQRDNQAQIRGLAGQVERLSAELKNLKDSQR